MTQNWNTLDGFYVDIPEAKEIIFPDKCLVCNKKIKNSSVNITGNPVGYFGLWKFQFGFNPKITVPAHVDCGKQLKSNIRSRNFFLMFIVSIVLLIGLYFNWERWQTLTFLFALILPPIYWQLKNAPSFEFELEDGVFEFRFSNKEYAEEFAKSNGVKVSKAHV
ncbi:MAG: hypothetical protein K8R67_18615 [Desulfobacteraceae bacterium]|nr:hypothetical protein [Desulfobacteraceae bacterium]